MSRADHIFDQLDAAMADFERTFAAETSDEPEFKNDPAIKNLAMAMFFAGFERAKELLKTKP